MTKEEAIEILQEEHDWVQEPSYVIKALEMAISAMTDSADRHTSFGYIERGEQKPCANCRWKNRHQKCSCCRRNKRLKDCYEEEQRND